MERTLGFENVRFVHRNAALVERVKRAVAGSVPGDWDPPIDFAVGTECWIPQTFVNLRRLGVPVTLAIGVSPNAINVLHYDHLPRFRSLPFWAFIVAVQADRPRPTLAQVRVVQNRLGVRCPDSDGFVPHWPQPRLVARDPSRGEAISRLSYFGLERYLAPELRGGSFQRSLAEHGVDFVPRYEPAGWNDYRDVDAVLAVRQVTEFDLSLKPASKLVNAWRSGAIALMGPEPAYRQIGRPGVDYLEVRSADDVLGAVRRLKERPDEAARLREAGARAALAYSEETIARRWVELLETLALPAYARWRRQWRIGDLLALPMRYAEHRREVAHFWANI